MFGEVEAGGGVLVLGSRQMSVQSKVQLSGK